MDKEIEDNAFDMGSEVEELLEGIAPPPMETPPEEPEESEDEESEDEEGSKGEEEEEESPEEEEEGDEGEEEEEEKGEEEEEEKEPEEEKKKDKEPEEDSAEELRQRLEDLAAKVQAGEPLTPAPEKEKEEEEKGEPEKGKEEEEPSDIPEFVTEAEFGDALINREALNSLLIKVYNKAIVAAREEAAKVKDKAVEDALLRTPDVVAKLVENKLAMERAVNDFYKQNPHLANYKQYVGMVATRLRAEHPDWDLAKLTEDVAETASKELGLKAGSTIVDKGGRKPAFAEKPKGGKPSAENLTGLEKEISDLM